jgi:voltage-gated potassium channel Kch
LISARIRSGDRVLVAASGGPDSSALLVAARELGCDVVAAHYDHALQAGSAAAAQHVAVMCRQLGVELVTALESRFGLRLPVMALGETPSIDSLAARVIAMLRKTDEPRTAGATMDDVKQVVLQHDAEVTPESIARFAEELDANGAEGARRMIH